MAIAITRQEHAAAELRREAAGSGDSAQARLLLALALVLGCTAGELLESPAAANPDGEGSRPRRPLTPSSTLSPGAPPAATPLPSTAGGSSATLRPSGELPPATMEGGQTVRALHPPALILGAESRAGSLPLRSKAVGLGLTAILVAAGDVEAMAPPPLDLLVAPEAFAARIPAGAPPPLKRGDLAICDPQGACAEGDLVLAEKADGAYLVGILRQAGERGCVLRLETGEVTLGRPEMRRLYRIAEIRIR